MIKRFQTERSQFLELEEIEHATLHKLLSLAIKNKDLNRVNFLVNNIFENVRIYLLNLTFSHLKPSRRYRHKKECLFQEPLLLFQTLRQGKETVERLLKAEMFFC